MTIENSIKKAIATGLAGIVLATGCATMPKSTSKDYAFLKPLSEIAYTLGMKEDEANIIFLPNGEGEYATKNSGEMRLDLIARIYAGDKLKVTKIKDGYQLTSLGYFSGMDLSKYTDGMKKACKDADINNDKIITDKEAYSLYEKVINQYAKEAK